MQLYASMWMHNSYLDICLEKRVQIYFVKNKIVIHIFHAHAYAHMFT